MPPLPSGPAEASRGCPVGLGAGGGWERSPAGRVPRPAQGSHPPPPPSFRPRALPRFPSSRRRGGLAGPPWGRTGGSWGDAAESQKLGIKPSAF